MVFFLELLLQRALGRRLPSPWYLPVLLIDVSALSTLIYFLGIFGVYLTPLYLSLIIVYYSRLNESFFYVVTLALIGFVFVTGLSDFWEQNTTLAIVIFFALLTFSISYYIYRKTKDQALFDPLTGLPNRSLFQDRLDMAIKGYRRSKKKSALLFMDLDGFKQVNDTLGHNVGDQLLKEVSDRLRNIVRETDTIARLGGDEFAIILNDIGSSAGVPTCIADKVLEEFTEPYQVNERLIDVGISIGISICPDHSDDMNDLIRFADVAMYSAKKDKSGYVVYCDEHNKSEIENLRLIADLRSAIKEDRLEIVYQPKTNLHTGNIESVEALIRWEHAELGLIPPVKFVSLAEDSVIINDLTEWVVRTALRDCANWDSSGCSLNVSVNISARNLQNKRLMVQIMSAIEGNKLRSDRLTLEITETSFMTQSDITIKNLVGLSMMGVSLSIDDFGTGHASLIYVQKLPIKEIKIDRLFVSNMLKNRRDSKIVQSIIHLAHDIGCRVVAEGVESNDVMERLKEMDCDLVQGFYISEPMRSDRLLGWLMQHEY
jgi:diguanylate cyclase (GGDEF)-like protein